MNITELLDRPIAYHRVFVTLTGSVKAAILLSQATYWQKRARQADGWWYKSAEEWEEETGLTRREQETARRDCGKYLMTDLRGVPATLYWKVDEQELTNALIQFGGNVKTGLHETSKLDSPKTPNINRNAEITTETTQKADYNLLFKGDFREYPEHLWNIAQTLQTEWGFALPTKPQKKHSKGEYAFFIMAMDDIKSAAGEFKAESLLTDVRREFVDYMEKHGGVAPFTVGKPTALITSVSAKAREMRIKPQEKPREFPPAPDYSDAVPNPFKKPLILTRGLK